MCYKCSNVVWKSDGPMIKWSDVLTVRRSLTRKRIQYSKILRYLYCTSHPLTIEPLHTIPFRLHRFPLVLLNTPIKFIDSWQHLSQARLKGENNVVKHKENLIWFIFTFLNGIFCNMKGWTSCFHFYDITRWEDIK